MSADMNETPDEPRPPGEDAGDQQDRWPYRQSNPPTPSGEAGQTAEPGQPGQLGLPEGPPMASPEQPPLDSPTQQALSDLPPLDDDVAETAGRRRWFGGGRLVAASVVVVALLGGGVALARSGGDSDGGSDGVATVDGADGDQAQADDSSGGNSGPANQSEMQDAMLEYAECMRDHGIDMPDPEFNGDGSGGGMVIQGGPGGEGGATGGPAAQSEEFEAADEECNDILEEVRGDMPQLSPEEVAEMQDKLVAMAECMRGKGYDMPDPQVNGDGGVQIEMRGGDADGSGGPPSDEMQQDQQECNEQAGLQNGPLGGAGGASTDGGSST